MSYRQNILNPPRRVRSDAEQAMSANAISRASQGRAEDLARPDVKRGSMEIRSEEHDLDPPGHPSGRIVSGQPQRPKPRLGGAPSRPWWGERQDREAEERAEDEGMGQTRGLPE